MQSTSKKAGAPGRASAAVPARGPRVAFVGAGSTVFMKNIVGDILQRTGCADAHFALMDIDAERLEESALVARKLIASLACGATVSTHTERRAALEGADFVVVAFQIGGYEPATVTDFEVPKRFGLRQTIADTLGVGGIMRGLRTVPHLWALADDMAAVCPDAIMLQYVNPMAINTWALAARNPRLRQVGLCHSVRLTAADIARDLAIPVERLRYEVAGINHIAFYTRLEAMADDGSFEDLYPRLREGYRAGRIPLESDWNPRCPNLVRYDLMMKFGYFVTESSEHFAEYVPWYIKRDRPDLIERFRIPLDEYPQRCVEQVADWTRQAAAYREAETIEVGQSVEYAADIVEAVWTGRPALIHGNLANDRLIDALPHGCAVEVPCLVDRNGVQPVRPGPLPPQCAALMRTSVNVQELTVAALMEEKVEHIYHAAYLDPHTAAELDMDQITELVDTLLEAHGEWMPAWARPNRRRAA